MSSTIRTPKIFEVIIVLLLFFMIMILSTAVYDIPLQLAMLVVWFLFIGYGLYLGYTYNHLQKAIADGIHSGIEATLVLT
ncbi:MAG TPA: Na+/H+ antiporter NhaC, partial [Pseudogracilibacillus sp.]|nr:Na+/H+ antiporter NhaC [Pseudogracilibacillus sp.]